MYCIGVLLQNFGIFMYKPHDLRPEIVVMTVIKVKWSRYRPGVTQGVGRGTRRGWVVSSTPRPNFTPGKDPVPILQEAGWTPGPVWTGRKSRPHRHLIPNLRTRSQSLYRLSYSAHSDDRNSVNFNTFGSMKKLILGALTKLRKSGY